MFCSVTKEANRHT